MAIAELQLETWSRVGSGPGSRDTYDSVRAALESPKAVYKDKDYEVFLQGSYGNGTNIYGESDVDTVIRLGSIWRSNLSDLPQEQQDAYHQSFGKATYTFNDFKKGVVLRLETAFGKENVEPGNKAIKIKPNGARRSADVVVCYQYRNYYYFISPEDQGFTEGVIFPTQSSGEIINYPKLHSENLTAKHQATNGLFKPMVRIFKNLRSKLVEYGKITKDTAPSYYIEGMLWNIPAEKFGTSYQASFINCFNWVWETNRSLLKCAHEQHALLGTSNVQWSSTKCDIFLGAVKQHWNES